MNVSDKVTVSTATATVLAGAVCTVALFVVRSRYQIDVPPDVRDALVVLVGALLTGALTLAAGWLRPEEHPAPSAIRTTHERGLKE